MATDPNLEAGIAAVRAGDLSTAQQRLALVVRASPESVDAWWWLAQAMTDPRAAQILPGARAGARPDAR